MRSGESGIPLETRIRESFEEADRLWAEATATVVPGELACRGGCFGCCVGLFEITLPEALLVREGFSQLPPEEREDSLRRAARIVERTAKDFPGEASTGVLDPERTEEADDRYFEVVSESACPMLELPGGRCRIYAHRPITCRTFGLAWKRSAEVVNPACPLNFPEGGEARQQETAIDLDLLTAADQVLAEAALAAGLPAGLESTIPHAVVGSVFSAFGNDGFAGTPASPSKSISGSVRRER